MTPWGVTMKPKLALEPSFSWLRWPRGPTMAWTLSTTASALGWKAWTGSAGKTSKERASKNAFRVVRITGSY